MRSVLDLAGALADRGHRVGLATCSPIDIPAVWVGPPAPKVIPLRRGPGGFRFSPPSVRIIRSTLDEYDVVHFNNIWNPELIHFAALARAAQRPYVITPHGTLDPWSMRQSSSRKRAYLAAAGSKLFREAAAVHFTASEERQAAARWIAPRLGAVIPYVLDLRPFTAADPRATSARERPRLLFLSRVHEKKRPDLLIEAVAVLRDMGIDTDLLIAGSGPSSYVEGLQMLTSRLDLTAQVRFLGNVTGQAKLDAYRSADLFVVPTSQENFGIVFAEALASGIPVVATTGTDIWRELLETGGAAVIDLEREPKPAQALATVIAGLLKDPEHMKAMAVAGRQGVLSWLDIDRTCQLFEQFYGSVLDTSRGPHL